MLTAGSRDQFPRWRRSRQRLSVCSVLRCPDLWLQCSVSFGHGLEKTLHCNHRSRHLKTEHTESLFLLRRHLGNWPRDPSVSIRRELLVAHEKLGQLLLLLLTVCPCRVRNKFHVNLWSRTILLCISCIYIYGPGSSVGIAIDYGLDGPGSNPGGYEIFCPSRPALGPTQPPVKWVPGLSWGKSVAGACCWPSSAAVMEE